MSRSANLLLTALAPMLWGLTYSITTTFLPQGYPLTVALIRALAPGLILLVFLRQLPTGTWWWRVFVLGAFNFTIFFAMLFVAAYRLPGGVAATVGAVQPLIVVVLARLVLGTPLRAASVLAAVAGVAGVALLVLTPHAALDPVGVAAGLIGAAAMAVGIVLTRRWQPPVSALTFTAWQMAAGGLLLVPLALAFEPRLPALTATNIAALAFLAVVSGALAYLFWFRGIAALGAAAVAPLVLLSPLVAVVIGWAARGERLTVAQIVGSLLVLGSVWVGQRPQKAAAVSAVESRAGALAN
jgi:probable blue pigment (indigoidine) exporter